jgi:two-component system LytT family response regulator
VVAQVGAERMPPVVFVTAHDRYAVRAFELSALDYLLKPVTAPRFAQAMVRAKAQLRLRAAADTSQQIHHLLDLLAAPTRYLQRLAVRTGVTTSFVEVAAIDWIEAAENYVELHVGAAQHLLHVALTTLEKSLDPARFIRVHRRAIVPIDRICAMKPTTHGEYVITLASGASVRSGRTYHDAVKALLVNPFDRPSPR